MTAREARSIAFFVAAWMAACGGEGDAPQAPPAPEAAESGHKAIVTEVLEPYECGSVQRLHTLGGVFLASQPQPADFEQAKLGGVKTVINQRHAEENQDFDERAVVTGLGLAYHNPAWNGADELTDEILDETLDLLRTAERPILIHCSSANRTGATWLAYRAVVDGIPLEEAAAEAKVVGLRSPDFERIASDYVARRRLEGGGR